MSKIFSVVGGNFGSESKGAAAAYLAADNDSITVVRVAGPNAGHSAIGVLDGKKYAMCQVPVAAVTNLTARLVIAAGSEIDPAVLNAEVDQLDNAGYKVSSRLIVDGAATFMMPEYAQKEQNDGMWERLGSTAHGIGEARAARIMRTALTWEQALQRDVALAARYAANTQRNTGPMLMQYLRDGNDVMIEGTQGYGLGLHGKFYPQCTSSDTRTIDFLAMAGISPWGLPGVEVEPWVVVRTFPIRVAGNSGPMYKETTWEALVEMSGGYIQPEKTTVTKRIRRVGHWDPELAREAVEANGGPEVCKIWLGFLDYVDPSIAGATKQDELTNKAKEFIAQVEADLGCTVQIVGTGPGSAIDLR